MGEDTVFLGEEFLEKEAGEFERRILGVKEEFRLNNMVGGGERED